MESWLINYDLKSHLSSFSLDIPILFKKFHTESLIPLSLCIWQQFGIPGTLRLGTNNCIDWLPARDFDFLPVKWLDSPDNLKSNIKLRTLLNICQKKNKKTAFIQLSANWERLVEDDDIYLKQYFYLTVPEHFLHTWYCKALYYICLFIPTRTLLLSAFHKSQNWGLERLNDLPTWKSQNQTNYQSTCSNHYTYYTMLYYTTGIKLQIQERNPFQPW